MVTSGTLQALAMQHKTSAPIYAIVMPFQLMKVPPAISILAILVP